MDKPCIKHGMFQNYTGSCTMNEGGKAIFVTITDGIGREEATGPILPDIRVKLFPSSRPLESLCICLISRILDKYIIREAIGVRTLSVNVLTNCVDLAQICNAVAIACLDGGIPLSSMFYCAGSREKMFVFSNGVVDFYHSEGAVTSEDFEVATEELERVKERIHYAFKDAVLDSW